MILVTIIRYGDFKCSWVRARKGPTVHFLYHRNNCFQKVLYTGIPRCTQLFIKSVINSAKHPAVCEKCYIFSNTPSCLWKLFYIQQRTQLFAESVDIFCNAFSGLSEVLYIPQCAQLFVKDVTYSAAHPAFYENFYIFSNALSCLSKFYIFSNTPSC
jgi:hypothetical protein